MQKNKTSIKPPKTLTVVVPLYNEEKRLRSTFAALKSWRNLSDLVIEKFVLVSDGSTDKTVEKLEHFKHNNHGILPSGAQIEVISYCPNHGRGFAVMQGLKRVESDFGMFLDGDMSIPLSNLKTFRKYLDEYDVLVGSKKIAGTVTLVKRGFVREFIGEGHTWILRKVLGIDIADFTGGFKVFSRAVCRTVIPNLTQERWGLDPEVIYVANRMGFAVKELPIVWRHVSKSSKVNLVRDITRAFEEMSLIRLNDWKGVYGRNDQNGKLVVGELVTVG